MAAVWASHRGRNYRLNYRAMDIVSELSRLTKEFGAPCALAVVGFIMERRANRELQRKFLRLAAAQLAVSADIKAALDVIKEKLRDG